MKPDDPRPVLLRISKLEQRLREKPKSRWDFLKDSSKIISVSAFIVSMITTIYSWRKDDLQAHEAARRQFDATMEQLVDVGFKNYEFTAKNKNERNFGAIAGWFNAQSGLMANKALQELAAINDASMFDYTLVGNTLLNVAQPARASALFEKAIEIGEQKKREREQPLNILLSAVQSKIFGDKLDVSLSKEQRVHDLSSAYVSLGQSRLAENKKFDSDNAYKKAIQTYEESDQSEDAKRNAISFVHKFWAEAMINVDCRSSLDHLRTAADYFPDGKKVADNPDWTSINYELEWGTTHCGADGKLHGDTPVASVAGIGNGGSAVAIQPAGPIANTLPIPKTQ